MGLSDKEIQAVYEEATFFSGETCWGRGNLK